MASRESATLESTNGSTITRDISAATAPAILTGCTGVTPWASQSHAGVTTTNNGFPQVPSEGFPYTDDVKRATSGELPPPYVLVPSGSFGILFSAYFALAMGAPLGELVPSVSATSVVKELRRNSFLDVGLTIHVQYRLLGARSCSSYYMH